MSTNLSPYNMLVTQLLLPQDILDIVEAPFKDRGYPLIQEVTYDYEENELTYFVSICEDQKVVLLHMAGDVIADRSNFRDIVAIANVFITAKTAGLFFFAPIKDLNREYNLILATRWKDDHPTIKETRFFDQAEIDTLKAKATPNRNRIVSRLMSLDSLLPTGNGSGRAVAAPLDLTKIQDRIAELVYKHYQTVNADPRDFFISIRNNLKWPPGWSWEPKAIPRDSAVDLVVYLIGQKTYPPGANVIGYKPLGTLLSYLIALVGGDDADEIYQIIAKYRLIEIEDVMAELKQKYCLPGSD
jgi:hypothetical protein